MPAAELDPTDRRILRVLQEDTIDAFSAAVSARPEVLDCRVVFGDRDVLLTVVARDVEDCQRFVFDTPSSTHRPSCRAWRGTVRR